MGMAFCTKCGNAVDDSAKFCSKCGTPVGANSSADMLNNLFNKGSDQSGSFDNADIENNKIYALFSYLGILFLVPLLAAPNSKFARFHVNQGLALFICEAIYGVFSWIITGVLSAIGLGFMAALFSLIGLAFLALTVYGIYNVVNGKAVPLPVIGTFKIL